MKFMKNGVLTLLLMTTAASAKVTIKKSESFTEAQLDAGFSHFRIYAEAGSLVKTPKLPVADSNKWILRQVQFFKRGCGKNSLISAETGTFISSDLTPSSTIGDKFDRDEIVSIGPATSPNEGTYWVGYSAATATSLGCVKVKQTTKNIMKKFKVQVEVEGVYKTLYTVSGIDGGKGTFSLTKSHKSANCADNELAYVEIKDDYTGDGKDIKWEITDACSGKRVAKGDFGKANISPGVCMDTINGRYKITMLNGLAPTSTVDFVVVLDPDGDNTDLVEETTVTGSGYEAYFGEGSCCAEGESLVQGTLLTDENPEETSYELRDTCSGEIIKFVDFDEDQEFYQSASEVCVPDDGKYRVSVSDTGTEADETDGIDSPGGFSVVSAGFEFNIGPTNWLPTNGLGPEFGSYVDFEFGSGNNVPCPSSGKGKSPKSKR